jgi:predicted AlkP superfamily phosphohydrolase/phosphomutase
MIADFMTPRGRRDFAYPDSLLSEIEAEFGSYRLHLSQTYAEGNVDAVLDELFDELEYKAKVAEYLMTRYEWDAFFAGADPLVLIASDHGFGPAHKYCSLNIWLLQEGFLKLKPDVATRGKKLMFSLGLTPEFAFKVTRRIPGALRPARGVSSKPGASKLLGKFFLSFNDVDWTRSVAFSKGNYGQIYVNLKGREPDGVVTEDQYEAVRDSIIERLRALKDPATGGTWVGQVFRREDIYNGPLVGDAPDIAFLPADMRYLPLGNADFTSNKFMVDAFGISGCHRMDGVMIANGNGIERGHTLDSAKIYDMAPTLLYLIDQSIPEDMDGRVLEEMIPAAFASTHALRFSSRGDDQKTNGVEYSDEENADVMERLKSLGYLG